ncbi:hypothetical protein M9458_026952, partial [Cirrhinus mrigala]
WQRLQRSSPRLISVCPGRTVAGIPERARGRLHSEKQTCQTFLQGCSGHTDILQMQRRMGEPERPCDQGESGPYH